MNEKIIFVRTSSGEDEAHSKTAHLSKDIKRALLMVDGTATVSEIMKRSSPSLRGMLEDMFVELVRGGYIRDKSKAVVKLVEPIVPAAGKSASEVEELDFTAAYRAPTPAMLEAEAARLRAKVSAELDTAALIAAEERPSLEFISSSQAPDQAALRSEELRKVEQQAAQVKAEAEARDRAMAEERARLEAEMRRLKAQSEAEARARVAAEAQAKIEAEAVRLQAQQEAQRLERAAEARLKAEQAAAQAAVQARELAERHARAEQEAASQMAQQAAQLKAEQEERARLEAEVANFKAQAEAETRARLQAEEKARQEVEAARVLAERQANEAARIKAEQQAEQARAQEQTRQQAEQKAVAEAEAARIKAEQQAAQIRAEAEARARTVAEERAKLEAEVASLRERAEMEEQKRIAVAEQVRLEVEAAKIRAQQEADAAKALAQQEAQAARAQAQQEAEAVRLQAQQQAERLAAEVVVAREQAEHEARRVRDEAEQARLQAAEASRAREEAERAAREAEVARLQAEQESAKALLEAEARVLAAEAAALKVQQEAERSAREQEHAARLRAEQEVSRVRAEVEAEKVHQQAEEERRKIAQAAAKVREAVERAKHVAELRAHEEAVRRANESAELLRMEQEDERVSAAQVRQREESEAHSNANMLAAIVRLNAKNAAMEESVFAALDDLAQQEAESSVELTNSGEVLLSEGDAGKTVGNAVSERRTTIAAVVFFDVVGYSSQVNARQIELKNQLNQIVEGSVANLGNGERVLLDTGDGAVIGFLQHPTDALETAMHFRTRLMANKHADYPDLRVRIGLHLGPVSLVKDLNGQINMLGDGINSAQRVMSFAGNDQIFVSRAYFDFVASLSDEYNNLFRYRGSQQDKHGREFQVYELLDADRPAEEWLQTVTPDHPVEETGSFTGFDLGAFDVALAPVTPVQEVAIPQAALPDQATLSSQEDVAGQLLRDAIGLGHLEVEAPVVEAAPQPFSQFLVESPVEVLSQEDESEPAFSEEEARQLADAQAKKWAEAEQRAAEIAMKNAEKASQKVFSPPVESASLAKPAVRTRRKPLPWGKFAATGVALLVAGLFVVPAVLPTQSYIKAIEQSMGRQLQQPVHIGQLSGRILPAPRLVLSDVSVGEAKPFQAHQVQVNFAFSALFSAVKTISSLELDGVQVNGAALSVVSDWLQQLAADRQYPVAHINFNKAQLEAEGISFSDVDGELDFDPSGKFSLAKLTANTHKLAVDIHAAPEQKMLLSVTLRDSALPLLPNWVFDELKASGELTRDELRITEMDSRIKGGVLTGEARINWRAGWRVQGALAARAMPLQNLNKLLSGDLDGSARYQMQSQSLAKLMDAAILTGEFSVNKGVINGMDVVETTRLRSRESLPGGRTHFEELSGEMAYANGSYQFRQLKMNDSVVRAVGSLNVSHQQLSGNVSSSLTMRAGMGTVGLLVGGTTESPALRAGN